MPHKRTSRSSRRLGIGIVGSGFNARFHIQAFRGVRDADVRGIWSPNREHAASAAALARRLDVGEARVFASLSELVADPAIDAIWLTGPNHARVDNVEEITDSIGRGKGTLLGLACEKPLARTVEYLRCFAVGAEILPFRDEPTGRRPLRKVEIRSLPKLAIVHGLMKRQNGTITLDSQAGAGTQVRLAFPAAPDRTLH